MKIWIVDDDRAYIFIVKMLIKEVDKDIEVTSFEDGDLAYDYITAHMSDSDALPDVILLDINMARMDGWDFLREYQKISSDAAGNISVYMLSSSISPDDISRAKSNPLVRDYITKPIEIEHFEEIYRVFRNKAAE